MANKYEKTVAQMAAFNRSDESAKVAGKEESGSEIIRKADQVNSTQIPIRTLRREYRG